MFSFFINTLTLLCCVFALLWYFSKSTFNFWHHLNVKYKKPLPLFGNLASFALLYQPFHECLKDLYHYFGDEPFGGIFQMRKPTLFVKDPNLITKILVTDFKYFSNRGFEFAYVNKDLNPLTGHLFIIDGDRWRILRNKISPVFTSGKLKLMHNQIDDCVDVLNKFIENNLNTDSNMNMKDLFERFTIDVIGSCAFGLECNSLKDSNEFRIMGVRVFKPNLQNAVRILIGTFSKKLLYVFKIQDFKKDVTEFFLNVVLKTVAYRRKNGVVRNDFLQLTMELQNTCRDPKYGEGLLEKNILVGEEFDEIDIAANAFLFFAAGFETTASTLSFCLYEMAINQDIQEKLRQEVQTVKTQCGGKLTVECLKDFNYMDMVLAETLRKYPPLPVLFRECCEDYVIPGTKIRLPVGTKIIIPSWSIQHDWRYYENPEEFNPERFSSENKLKRLNGTYIPFGDGPRYCIGKRFAFMEMKAALADIITKYEFKPCTKTEIPLTFNSGSILMSPRNGIWLDISKLE